MHYFFLDEQTGWVIGNGFFKTTNGGTTWNSISGTNPGVNTSDGSVFFSTAITGYITDPYSIYKTSDGGANFIKLFGTYTAYYHDIGFVDSQTGYITDRQYILKTIDAGQTWTKEVVLAQGELIELHFTDASHGWAGGSSGLILKYER